MKSKIYLVSVMALTLGISLNAQNNQATATQSNTMETASVSDDNKRILSRLGGKAVPDNMSAEHRSPLKQPTLVVKATGMNCSNWPRLWRISRNV